MTSDATAHSRICRGCWDQMHVPIPIRGPLSLPFRAFGITQSKMNPEICTICERAFSRVHRKKQIEAEVTILFADIRGFTALSERLDPLALSGIVGTFQDGAAHAVWAHDGIVNKQMGDGLMAIFNFPINNPGHARAGVAAAIDIQRRFHAAVAGLEARCGNAATAMLGVGVGVHTGRVAIGEFSSDRSDFTAIGSTVNLAARLEAAAEMGEVIISAETAHEAGDMVGDATQRKLLLKGISKEVMAQVLSPLEAATLA